jgi:SulP family sulfate permease
VFATLSPIVAPGSPEYVQAVFTLAFIVGVALLAVGLFRLGAVANFISHTVVVAFSTGVGILIATTQLGELFGMTIPRGAFLKTWQYFLTHLAEIGVYPTLVAAITIAVGLASQRLIKRVPYPLIASWRATWRLWISIALGMASPASGRPAAEAPLRQLYPTFGSTIRPIAGIRSRYRGCLIESISIARSSPCAGQRSAPAASSSARLSTSRRAFPASRRAGRSTMANHEAGARHAMIATRRVFLIVFAVAPLVAYLPYRRWRARS